MFVRSKCNIDEQSWGHKFLLIIHNRIVEGAPMRADLNWTPERGASSVTQILETIKANIDFARSIPTDERGDAERLCRWRERHSRKQRFAVLANDTPSWLASMAFHALAMVVLGSLVGSNIRADRAPITLLMSTSDERGEDARQTSPVEIAEPYQTLLQETPEESLASTAPTPASAPPATAPAQPIPKATEPTEANDTNDGHENIDIDLPNDLFDDPPSEAEEETVFDLFASPTVPEVRPVTHKERSPEPKRPKRPNRPKRQQAPRTQEEFDHVVDQFIKFDIGRLRGQAGQQANQRFRELGPEAIPALVRGLNKSAYISASCPVGVISSKLTSTVRDSHDPEMLQYVLNHLGDNVSKSAPHYSRIQSVRNKLERTASRERRSEQTREPASTQKRPSRSSVRNRFSQTSTQQPAQQLLRTASMFRRQGRSRESTQVLKQLVTQFPNTREAKIARNILAGR